MKKTFRVSLFILIATLLLTLCGCSTVEGPETVTNGYFNGVPYTITPGIQALEYEGTVYSYDVVRKGKSLAYSVTYPNGGIYRSIRGNEKEKISTEGLYDPATYPEGDLLVDILSKHFHRSGKDPNLFHVFISIIFLLIGIFHTFFPEDAWYLRHAFRSWQYESIEPSMEGLRITRLGGIFLILVGVIYFFTNWS